LFSALPTPAEIRSDVEANPYRPQPAAVVQDSGPKRTKEVAPPIPAPAATTTVATAPSVPGSGAWTVQLVAISNPDAARNEQKRLEKILGGTVDLVVEGPMNKLRWGSFASKEEAETAKAALKAKSVDGFVVHR
ncbi:MAG TPA: SPOR domain-containing protein, partial [Fibrobacteria bacterium]|nr:SPOR domain-containing protein [Fibrobacteria bacterium]